MLKQFFHVRDNKECEIIFEEGGRASVRLSNGEVRHSIPTNHLRTAEQQAAWLLVHPKNQEYLHEVLEVVDATKRNPKPADETDEPWMHVLRTQCSLHANVRENSLDMRKFTEQYCAATGETADGLFNRPGVYLRARGGWANFLYIEIPKGANIDGLRGTPVNTNPDGSRTINNTRFIWMLIAREGFRLDP